MSGRLHSSSFGIPDDYGHSELKVYLDGISVDEFHQSAGKHHLFNQPADHHLLPGSQHQPATAAAPGGYSSV